MKARKLLEGASYGPEAVKALCETLDQAWDAVRDGVDPADAENVRLRLAEAVLANYWAHQNDQVALIAAAVADFYKRIAPAPLRPRPEA